MKSNTQLLQRLMTLAICSLVLLAIPAVIAPPAFTQQQGGNYALNPTLIPGGGGSSAAGTISLSGSVGQGVLGTSMGGSMSLNAGFWQGQPAGMINISGRPIYCVSSTSQGVPNATLNLTGDVTSSTITDASGNYQFPSLPAGGTFTVTPTKAGAVSGINAQDIGRVRRFVALLDTPTACQTAAGNVDNANPAVNAQDVGVLRRYVALLPGTGDAGTWKFNPPSRTFVNLNSNQEANFDATLVGDVDGNWTPAAPQKLASPASPMVNLTISLPNVSANQGVTFFVPVTISGALAASDNVLGYTLDLTFNPGVAVALPDPGVSFFTAGTISAAGTVTENKTLGANRYRLVVDFNNPLVFSGTQTLIYLKFNVVGAPGQTTALTWNLALPPEFGNGPPAITTTPVNGSLSVNDPTVVSLVSFAATTYQSGVHLEWKTGFEVNNLGFNVYREERGKLTPVNSQLIAGSGLKIGQVLTIRSGYSYQWWDSAGADSSTYWLEDRDLNGGSQMHGPFHPVQAPGKHVPNGVQLAKTLAELSAIEAPSVPVETRARTAANPAGSSSPEAQAQLLIAASADTVKLRVKREAWYRVTSQELFDAGLDTSLDPHNLRLFVDGKEQAINVTGEDDGRFDSADSVEFYGMAIDSSFTDLRTYYLVAGRQAGLRISRIQSPAHPAPSGGFPFSVERRDRTIYFASLRNGDTENFFGAVVAAQPINQSMTLSHLTHSGAPATLNIALQGVTQVSHLVTVQLNGSDAGQLAFQGQARGEATINVSPSLLREGLNQVTLIARGGPSDVSLVDYIRLTYQHSFAADENKLKFTVPAGQQVTIDGFTSKSIRVLDVTDPLAVQEVLGHLTTGEGSPGVSLIVPGTGERRLLALTDDKASRVANVAPDHPSRLSNPAQGADLLIITRRELFDSARPLIELRQKEGLSVAIVDIEDVYDEFSFGHRSPRGLKDFLSLATTGWKKRARYVLLLGDSSLDPKNYFGLGDFDLVPTRLIDTTFMETASDDWLADFNGDGIADVAIGRLPVRDRAEASLIIGKIVGYERSSPSDEALLVSDHDDGFDFEASSELLIVLMPENSKVTHLKRGELGDQAAHAALIDAMNRGQLIVNYNGHGTVDAWRSLLFNSTDALQLWNLDRLSMFVMMNCLNGYFQDPALDSLAEALLKAPGGGAVAVWASSAMTFADLQAPMNREFYRQVFANPRPRMGDAAIRAKAVTPDPDVRLSWVLLGDPTMRLK